MIEVFRLLKFWFVDAVRTRVGAVPLLLFVHSLLDLHVEMEHAQTEIIPEFRVATQGTRCFFKVLEGL